MIRHIRHACLALALITGLTGCGYGLVGRSSNLPPDVQQIYIEPLENATLRQQVDRILTQAISDEFIRRKRFTLVNSILEADAVLRGKVTSFRVRPVLFGAEQGRASDYEIQIMASMVFRRTDNEAVLWEQPFYSFTEQYEFDATQLIDLEDVALLEVSADFAQTIVIDLLEGF